MLDTQQMMTIVVQQEGNETIEFSKSVLTLREVFSECQRLKQYSYQFANKPNQEVRDSDGVLYVRQKEDAVTYDGDRLQNGALVKCCGTEDVLTCHVVILHHPEAKVTAIAHFDEYVKEPRLQRYVHDFRSKVLERLYSTDYDETGEEECDWEWEEVSEDGEGADEEAEGVLDGSSLVLVGGYDDEAKKSAAISQRILSFFSKQRNAFNLELCCLGPANTIYGKGPARPKVGGVVATIRKGGKSKKSSNIKPSKSSNQSTSNYCQIKVSPASFQRSFVNQLSEEAVKQLMLGPSLIKKPNKLKKMILDKEDQGFSKGGKQNGQPIHGL